MKILKRTVKAVFFLSVFSLAGSAIHAQNVAQNRANELQNAVPVTGIIKDAATGKPLGGISVRYKEFSAAITDTAGRFTLKVPDYSVAISIESEGYQSKEIALKGRKMISSDMYEDAFTSFYDLANLPSGQRQQNKIPYAVTSVPTQGAWGRSFETPDSYLQGKVAGLNAIRRSGTPGIGANLFLRGYNSLYGTNQPLIVVDGVIYDNTNNSNSLISGHNVNPLAYMDIKDIDNFTVLKDGSSIYGTKGANGVILITTARARELATRIDFAAYGGINFAPSKIPVLNSSDYRVYLSDVLQSSGLSNTQIQALPYMNDNPNNPDYYRYHYNTDWQKQVLDKSYGQNVYLKVTGGDNIAKYALSLGYFKNAGVIKNTDLSRYNTRFNADLNLSKRLTATANLSYTLYEQDLKDQGMASKTNPLYLSLIKAPILSTREVSSTGAESPDLAQKDTFNVSNPAAIMNNMLGKNRNYRFFGSLGFNYNFSKAVSLATTINVTMDKVRENIFVPRRGTVPDTLSNAAIATNRSGSHTNRLFALFNDTRLSYNKTFGRIHELSASAGTRFIHSKNEDDLILGYNSATDELKSVTFGIAALRRVGGDINEWRWMNNYLNADYSLLDKYFLSFNLAADASSRFGSKISGGTLNVDGTGFVILPSLSAAWLVSSENFMANSSAIELLKLRATVSYSGNDDIGNYTARQNYVSQNFLGIQGLVRGGFGNPSLKPERVGKINAGIDLAMFNERFNLSLDVYRNETENMIINETAPAASGMTFAVSNGGGMKTTGIEANINGRILNHASLKWDVGVQVAAYRSKISTLPVNSLVTGFGGANILSQAGNAPNLFYGYKTDGIYASDAEAARAGDFVRTVSGALLPFRGGDVRFSDINGDNRIDDNDRQVIGDPNPDFFGSFSTAAHWKKWSMDALFTFSQGNDVYNYTRNQLESLSGFGNQTIAVLNRWRSNGDVTGVPKAAWGDPMGNARFSDRWIEDGSYFRLRAVTLSYSLPIKADWLKYSTVYATGNNVFTLSKFLGYDPEFSAGNSILNQGINQVSEPQYRSVQVGVRIGL